MKYLLEVVAQDVRAVQAAQRGGASRIELCSELEIGGITPAVEVMQKAREAVAIPIFAMVRPRGGNFVFSPAELEKMAESVMLAKNLGMDGVVLGALTPGNEVDTARTSELVRLAAPLPVTFHRAFDACENLRAAMEHIVKTGARRILSSGGAADALSGAPILAALTTAAGERIKFLPGGGIGSANIREVAERSGALELHSGLGNVLPYGSTDYDGFEREVRAIVRALEDLSV